MRNLIVFKTHSFPNISETFIVSNIIETIKKGYDVKIIVDTINTKTNTSQIELLDQYKLMDKVSKMKHPIKQKVRKIKAVYLLFNPVLFYYFIKYIIYKKKKSLDYIFTLHYYFEYRKAKIFHVHFATAINPLFELKRIGFFKPKIVVTFHGYDAHFLPQGEQLVNLINDFSEYVTHITVNSQFVKNKLVANGFCESQIIIVPIAIDTTFFKRSTPLLIENNMLKLITVGRLVELKGQEYGVRVIKLLIDAGFSVYYTIVGDGEQLLKLKTLTQQLNLENHVVFLGNRNQIEIKELLEKHHVFLMTSTVDQYNRREAFGLVSIEAQSMDLPVIGFESGGFPETLENGVTGFIVEDKNIEAMSNAIIKLIHNNNLLDTMSKNARNHIFKTYTFKKTIGQYFKLYQ